MMISTGSICKCKQFPNTFWSDLNNKFANFYQQWCDIQVHQKMDENVSTNMKSRFLEVNSERLGQ